MLLYTIGHSNLPLDHLLTLLRRHRVEYVVDVRSIPNSRYAPQYNRRDIERSLADAGFTYHYAGAALGGIPRDPELLGPNGGPDYALLIAAPAFQQALADVRALAETRTVALLCSEGDPMHCHRERLLARELRARGIEVRHILRDGTLAALPAESDLFPEDAGAPEA